MYLDVLVSSADETFRATLYNVFQSEGYFCVRGLARSGIEALRMARAFRPHIVVLEFDSSFRGDFPLTAIKADVPQAHVFVLAESEAIAQSGDALRGADAVIGKHQDFGVILAKADEVCTLVCDRARRRRAVLQLATSGECKPQMLGLHKRRQVVSAPERLHLPALGPSNKSNFEES